jgi:hypothetical protein
MWSYVNNELDVQYSKPLPKVFRLKEDDLPMAEFELRKLLANWLFSGFVHANSLIRCQKNETDLGEFCLIGLCVNSSNSTN